MKYENAKFLGEKEQIREASKNYYLKQIAIKKENIIETKFDDITVVSSSPKSLKKEVNSPLK